MYTIRYHHRVPDDIKRIGVPQSRLIRRAIEDKLAIDPQFFGKPLQFTLRGLRSMRVGDYRVVFTLAKQEIFVVLIAHRSTVYDEAGKRV